MSSLAILGAGSWGTALSLVLAPQFDSVRLWVHDPELASILDRERENLWYLPGFRLARNTRATGSLAEAVNGAGMVCGVVPCQYARGVWRAAAGALEAEALLVSAAKGLERDTLLRPSQVIAEETGVPAGRIAVLSGPSFARQVAAGDPTALVVASSSQETAERVQAQISTLRFRAYRTTDITGTEMGGALKNIVAIGAGICDGMELGTNSIAALITRGLAEITRLAVACGANRETLTGLAGLGDLVLTCTGEQSRNRQCGIALARGETAKDWSASTRMVAEGVRTTEAAKRLAESKQVEMPITEQMYAVIYEGLPPREAIERLMQRDLKPEPEVLRNSTISH